MSSIRDSAQKVYLVIFKASRDKLPCKSHSIRSHHIIVIQLLVGITGSVGQVPTEPVIHLIQHKSLNNKHRSPFILFYCLFLNNRQQFKIYFRYFHKDKTYSTFALRLTSQYGERSFGSQKLITSIFMFNVESLK